ncbi:hypothetical protein DPSP01_013136 [Paraphaeosphaeria sporulosa]
MQNNARNHSRTLDASSTRAESNEDWTQINDRKARKRVQNRLSQRTYREKMRRRLEDAKNIKKRLEDAEAAQKAAQPPVGPLPVPPKSRSDQQTLRAQDSGQVAPSSSSVHYLYTNTPYNSLPPIDSSYAYTHPISPEDDIQPSNLGRHRLGYAFYDAFNAGLDPVDQLTLQTFGQPTEGSLINFEEGQLKGIAEGPISILDKHRRAPHDQTDIPKLAQIMSEMRYNITVHFELFSSFIERLQQALPEPRFDNQAFWYVRVLLGKYLDQMIQVRKERETLYGKAVKMKGKLRTFDTTEDTYTLVIETSGEKFNGITVYADEYWKGIATIERYVEDVPLSHSIDYTPSTASADDPYVYLQL